MSWYLWLPLFQSALSLALIVIILRGNLHSSLHRVFSLYLAALMAWGIVIFFMRSSPDMETAYFWDKWAFGIGTFWAAFTYHFSVLFSNSRSSKWLVLSAYSFSILFSVLSGFNLIIKGMQVVSYGYAPVAGPLLVIASVVGGAFMVMALLNFLKVARTAPDIAERNRGAYILIGLIASLIGSAFDILPTMGFSLLPGFIIGNIIFCLITAAAILQYHLLGIQIVIRKGTAYLLASATVAIPYAAIILLFNNFFWQAMPVWAYVVLLILLAFALQPLWRWMQSAVDRLFYRTRYDIFKVLQDFISETRKISDISTLGTSLVSLISRALQSSDVYLLLPSNSGDFNLVSSTRSGSFQFSLTSHHPLLRWLQSNKSILQKQDLSVTVQLQSLTTQEKKKLDEIKAEMFIPIVTKGDELTGILFLGPKLSRQHYSEDDVRLVMTVTQGLAMELENSRLYSEEKRLRLELQKQDEQKTEFLHSVAHELRTPLTAIISSSELLTSGAPQSLQNKLAENISRSAWSMNRRVSELLDFAKIQIGNLQLEPTPLEIGPVLRETASQLDPLFVNKHQTLKLEIPEFLPRVRADRDKLEQVLINILSNANKFSSYDGCITLRTRKTANRLIIEVEDAAPPISEEERTKIFSPYYRGEDADRRQRLPGLGLGLAISKKIVELHGGEIGVNSNRGKGNIFFFSLPLMQQ